MVENKRVITLAKIDEKYVPNWFQGEAMSEEHPKTTHIGGFHVGASVKVGNEVQHISRITRRTFKNMVIHEVLECQDVVVLFAYDWEKVQPYAADVEKLRRFFSPSVVDQYRRSTYNTDLKDERKDMLLTWQPIKKFPNGEKINILPILFVKNGILEDFIDMEKFSIMVKEAPIERIGGTNERHATNYGVVQS